MEAGGGGERAVAALVFPSTGRAQVVGITGSPGAGKSSLASALVGVWRATGERVAVVAVDPTSPYSGGAILGDRVRMQDHATDPGVFVRSMATRGEAGGLARAAIGAVRVFDAAGWPVVLVETVGAGQVEVDIAHAADTTVVVVNPGWGDAIQANKGGLLEVADVLVVNKADRAGSDQTVGDLEASLDMNAPAAWRPPIVRTVATTGEGIADLRDAIGAHRTFLAAGGRLEQRRHQQLAAEVRRLVEEAGARAAWERAARRFEAAMADVVARRRDPLAAADQLAGSTPIVLPHEPQ